MGLTHGDVDVLLDEMRDIWRNDSPPLDIQNHLAALMELTMSNHPLMVGMGRIEESELDETELIFYFRLRQLVEEAQGRRAKLP